MKEGILKEIIKIDNNAKENVKDVEEKNKQIDKYIYQEIAGKKMALEAKYKDELSEFKFNYKKELDKSKNDIDIKTNNEIEKINLEFNKNKIDIANTKIDNILKKVMGE